MKKWCLNSVGILLVFACVCPVLISCATMGADAQFAKSFTSSEKADLLFQQGKKLYENDVQKNRDFAKIADARSAFEAALEVDQYHPLAPIYLDRLNSFAQTNHDRYVAEAEKLLAKETRTPRENYTLLRDIKLAGDIDGSSQDVSALRSQARSVTSAFNAERRNRLKEIESEIAAAESAAEIGKLASEAETLLDELEAVGSYGTSEERQRAVVETNLMRIVSGDMAKAEEYLANRQYRDTNTTVVAVEHTLKQYYTPPVPAVEEFKYRFYVQWVGALISVEAFNQADRTVDMALAIDPTEEACAYKQEIARKLDAERAKTAAAPRPRKPAPAPRPAETPQEEEETGPDYDAEIRNICAEIDQMILEDRMVEAWDYIAEIKPQLKSQTNVSALETKEANIYQTIPATYTNGISAYNNEDYESAIRYFRTVVGVAPDYEQAQAYLERSISRLRILSGAE